MAINIKFIELDIYGSKITDFSKPLPIGSGGYGLAYTDLKMAYTSQGAFIDPDSVNYKTYKNVDELQKEMKQQLDKDFKGIEYMFISSVAQQGLTELKDKLWKMLNV